ncbi:MAG TPA: GrpB family protein, partial [Trebonia sp.]
MGAPVEIVDYDPRWPQTFASLRDRIAAAVGPLARRIEHVGSTAVPGLPAKPVIDLDVVIATPAEVPEVIARLGTLGYRHEGDLGITGREAFAGPIGGPAHHLYVCAADGRELARHLALRDYLRTHPEQARAYAELK